MSAPHDVEAAPEKVSTPAVEDDTSVLPTFHRQPAPHTAFHREPAPHNGAFHRTVVGGPDEKQGDIDVKDGQSASDTTGPAGLDDEEEGSGKFGEYMHKYRAVWHAGSSATVQRRRRNLDSLTCRARAPFARMVDSGHRDAENPSLLDRHDHLDVVLHPP